MCQWCERESSNNRQAGWAGAQHAVRAPVRRRPDLVRRPQRPAGPVREQTYPRLRSLVAPGPPNPEAEFRRRMRDSCRAAGITEGIANFHGMLLYEAQRKGRNMSWERWQQIQNGDNTIVDAVFEDILENIVDNLRDEILDAMLGDIVSNLLGAPLEYVSAIRMIYDENQWNNRNNDERDRYRTHSVYLWLMAVVATNQSRRTGQNPGEILALLSHQALLYQVWWQQHYPAVERWIAESGLGTRRMSTAPRYLRIPR